MITEHDLQEAIAECEGQRNPNSNTCLKLAAYYTIKDRMYPDSKDPAQPVFYSRASAPVETVSDTDFSRTISGMDTAQVISVMDELMTTLKVVAPRLYAGVMNKLSDM